VNPQEAPRHAHAVVLEASLAGLFHAVVLATRFDRVMLVDRDTCPVMSGIVAGSPRVRTSIYSCLAG
jgi:hypothetical protein